MEKRAKRDPDASRRRVIESAIEIFGRKGYHGATTSEIAKNAGLSPGTIFLHFKSKEELFAALQQEGLEFLFQRVKAAGNRGKNPADKIRRIALVYLRFSRENKDYFDIINFFIASPEEFFAVELKRQVDQQGDKILQYVEKVIHDGMDITIGAGLESISLV